MKLRMKTTLVFLSVSCSFIVLSPPPAASQTRDEGPWWPHPIWGPSDQAGASNWITAEKILEAISLVRTGKVYELGHPYERGMPLLGQRTFAMFLAPGSPSPNSGLLFNDEYVCTELGQVGTQFDGLGHVGRRVRMEDGSEANVFYNGVTLMRCSPGTVCANSALKRSSRISLEVS